MEIYMRLNGEREGAVGGHGRQSKNKTNEMGEKKSGIKGEQRKDRNVGWKKLRNDLKKEIKLVTSAPILHLQLATSSLRDGAHKPDKNFFNRLTEILLISYS